MIATGVKTSVMLKLTIFFILLMCCGQSGSAIGKSFVVVIDAGHGGKDIGAADNGAKEKDINLAVAKRVGELVKKRMKNTKVLFTRDDDTFVSLQGRADIANTSKADLFISIHTNSVDKSNKNRQNVSGASVYALGLHKDENNMSVARRENSVIELEGNDYEHKYSGFDPSKDESYIIFEMAQKRNLAQSIRFANDIQKNLVDHAGRKDRGVHQAGFWVLWATSMPSVLIELDFICNPSSAKFMTSKEGVDKLSEGIFNAIRSYREKYHASTLPPDELKNKHINANRSIEEIMADAKVTGLIDEVAPETVSVIEPVKSENIKIKESLPKIGSLSGPRRRRTKTDAELSSAKSYQVGNISLLSEADGMQKIDEVDRKFTDDSELSTHLPSDKSKNKKKSKVKSSKHVTPQKNSKRNFKTIYTIQIMASDEQLSGNNPAFHGLSPIYTFRENNLYKYTYGEALSKEELMPLLKEVRIKIPDAFIISKTRAV